MESNCPEFYNIYLKNNQSSSLSNITILLTILLTLLESVASGDISYLNLKVILGLPCDMKGIIDWK